MAVVSHASRGRSGSARAETVGLSPIAMPGAGQVNGPAVELDEMPKRTRRKGNQRTISAAVETNGAAAVPPDAVESVEKPSDALLKGDRQPVFPFEFEISRDRDNPVPIRNDVALLQCSVRHFREMDINIVPGVSHEINLGIRLIDLDTKQLSYENRLFSTPKILQTMRWVPVLISIPRQAIELGETYILIVDFVREHDYWFADRGGNDYKYLITFTDVSDEPDILGRLAEVEQDLAALRTGIDNLDRRVERAAAEAAAGGRELSSLRDALNDTVWRTERSYLGLSEAVADQAQRVREALERVGELASQTEVAKVALGSRTGKTPHRSGRGRRTLRSERNCP